MVCLQLLLANAPKTESICLVVHTVKSFHRLRLKTDYIRPPYFHQFTANDRHNTSSLASKRAQQV